MIKKLKTFYIYYLQIRGKTMVWENSPSHICRGGDVRGLAFCCPPVKPCPIMGALKEVGLTPQEFLDIKQKFARETRLGEGPATCFDHLYGAVKLQNLVL